MAIDRNIVQQAYAFFHQKERVYAYSSSETEKDHIEDTIADYVNSMSPELYAHLSGGDNTFLREHPTFETQLKASLEKMEKMLFTPVKQECLKPLPDYK